MLVRKKVLITCALALGASLPTFGRAATADADAYLAPGGVRLTGYARPRYIESVPGSAAVGFGVYYSQPRAIPLDVLPMALPARNLDWNSGRHSFIRPERGHRDDGWMDDEGDDRGGHRHGHHGDHGDDHGGNPVPLPAPWTLLVSGLLLLVGARRLSAAGTAS